LLAAHQESEVSSDAFRTFDSSQRLLRYSSSLRCRPRCPRYTMATRPLWLRATQCLRPTLDSHARVIWWRGSSNFGQVC